ncbi:MAG TPA: hypothetical protein VGG19_07515 [Tepidisphaeraceae bacterium]|jgi:hypothetical protein
MKKCVALLAGLVMAAGCETTRPVVKYPGLGTAHGTPTCVVREANHCFIGSIDEHPIEQYDVNILTPGIYRQYRIPAGEHVLTIFYRESRNFEIISGGPRHITINVNPDRSYVIEANCNIMDVAFGDILAQASWRPEVVDNDNGKCVGQATLTVQ